MKSFKIVLLFFLLLFALFPKPILKKAIEWKLKAICKSELGAKLSYSSFEWHGGEIVVQGASLLKPFHFEIKCDEINFHFSKRNLDFNQVEITLCKRGDFPLENFSTIFDKSSIHTTVKEGRLLLYDYTRTGPLFQKIGFSLSHDAFLMRLGHSEKPIAIQFSQENDQFRLLCELQEREISPLFDVGKYFCSQLLFNRHKYWLVSNGNVTADLSLSYSKKNDLVIQGELGIENFKGVNPNLNYACRLDSISTSFDINFGDSQRSNGSFQLRDGGFYFGLATDIPGDFHVFNSFFELKEGKIENSKMKAALFGMHGDMTLRSEWGNPVLSCNFGGHAKSVLPLVPERHQEAFTKAFGEDDFSLKATVKKNPLGVACEGVLDVIDSAGGMSDLIWGCHFNTAKVAQNPHFPLLDDLKEQFSLSQSVVGWFAGNHFAVEKFLTPFLFRNQNLHMNGRVDFEGNFDENFLTIYYKGQNLSFEGPHFSVKVDSLQKGLNPDVVACHHFDLKKGTHLGFLPVRQARFHQKSPEFSFEDASCVAYFENQKIEMRQISASLENLHFNGEVIVDLPSEERGCELKISTKKVEGDFVSARNFLSKFFPSPLWRLPFDGKVASGDHGVFLHFLFDDGAKLLNGYVRGDLSCEYKNEFVNCKDLEFHFDYSRQKNALLLQQARGHFGFKNSVPYDWRASEIAITDFPNPKVNCALEIQKEGKELYKVVGKYQKDQLLEITGNLINLKGESVGKRLKIEEFCFGKLSGSADFDWEKDFHLSLSDVKMGDGKGFSLEGRVKKSAEDDKKLKIEELKWGAIDGSAYQLGALQCDLKSQKLSFNDVSFLLTKEKLELMHSFCHSFFPTLIPEKFFELIEMQHSPVMGRASFELLPNAFSLNFALKDGSYNLFGRDHDLRNLSFFYESGLLRLCGEIFYNGFFYPIVLTTKGMHEGEIILREHPGLLDSLCGVWKRDGDGKVSLERIAGKFCGLDIFLHKQDEIYRGKIQGVSNQFVKLLPHSWRGVVEKLDIGKGSCVEGDFDLRERKFSGKIYGKDFSLCKMELDSFSSILTATPRKVELKHLVVQDAGGKLEVERAIFENLGGSWHFWCPQLKMRDVFPIRLRAPTRHKKGFFDPLCIRFFHLNHFAGVLGNPGGFKGEGLLEFTNIPKKDFVSSLLFLPKEISSRIGLDFGLLIPARGFIHYEIHDGKVFLTKFREMYSEGRKSSFYLAGGHPAYIDFEGNLNLKVKMKQYNLLMKVAEFFVVAIKGDIFRPSYSLHNLSGDFSEELEGE